MPRRKNKSKSKSKNRSNVAAQEKVVEATVTSNGAAKLAVDPVTLMPDIEARTMKPGCKDYDPDKDTMIVGFQPGVSTLQQQWKARFPELKKIDDLTPYHLLTLKDGKRVGADRPPWGSQTVDLRHSIYATDKLPPLEIWRAGRYLSDLIFDEKFLYEELSTFLQDKVEKADWKGTGKIPLSIYNYFVTSGEGATGNNLYLVFEVPNDVASTAGTPRHPKMWKQSEFDKRTGNSGWSGAGSSYGSGSLSGGTTAQTKPKSAGLPAGVRMRHDGCGHWFKVDDLAGHIQVCGEDADWAMMCAPECGCRNLHEASTPRPGFPRPKTVEAPAETAEAPTTQEVTS